MKPLDIRTAALRRLRNDGKTIGPRDHKNDKRFHEMTQARFAEKSRHAMFAWLTPGATEVQRIH